MAYFQSADALNFGGNTPTGNFVPEIYSQKVLNFFRRKSIVEGLTNNDYYGEISAFGDSVRIIKEPTIVVNPLARGTTTVSQALEDNQITLVLDQANYFQFQEDDLEKMLTHINWMSLATSSAAYSLKQAFDKEVLTYMATNAGNVLNDDTTVLDLSTADALLNTITKLGVEMSLLDVPEEDRWLVVTPRTMEVLAKADSKLLNMDFNGGMSDLGNGLVTQGKLRGFSLYMTNNAPKLSDEDILMAGHMSSTATVSAILDTEVIRAESTFADIVRGKHVYGRSVIRPEALSIAYVSYGA